MSCVCIFVWKYSCVEVYMSACSCKSASFMNRYFITCVRNEIFTSISLSKKSHFLQQHICIQTHPFVSLDFWSWCSLQSLPNASVFFLSVSLSLSLCLYACVCHSTLWVSEDNLKELVLLSLMWVPESSAHQLVLSEFQGDFPFTWAANTQR